MTYSSKAKKNNTYSLSWYNKYYFRLLFSRPCRLKKIIIKYNTIMNLLIVHNINQSLHTVRYIPIIYVVH